MIWSVGIRNIIQVSVKWCKKIWTRLIIVILLFVILYTYVLCLSPQTADPSVADCIKRELRFYIYSAFITIHQVAYSIALHRVEPLYHDSVVMTDSCFEPKSVLPFVSSALKGQDTKTMEAEGVDKEEGEEVSSTAGPQLAGGVTERSNGTSNERSSQILYVITSSPGKPEHNIPGQWAGRSETTSHNASMLSPMIHCTYCTSLYLCGDVVGGFLASVSNQHHLPSFSESIKIIGVCCGPAWLPVITYRADATWRACSFLVGDS